MDRSPTVFVLTPDDATPYGGIRQHYSLVDLLNRGGIDAAIVHRAEGFRCRWFANDTRVISAQATEATERDLIVIPEEWAGLVHSLPAGVPKVIFNQGCYTTFHWDLGAADVKAAYEAEDVVATVVVSEDSLAYLRYALTSSRIEKVRCAIDPSIFRPGDAPEQAIAYLPRRRSAEAAEVLALLELRGMLRDWRVRPIDGLSQIGVASSLRSSSVFLSFGHREGFGLPPAEAMASGCLVVGFTGFGGREYFRDHAIEVADGDTLAFARAVEDVLTRWGPHGEIFADMRRAGSAFVRETYSPEAQANEALPLFHELMEAPRSRRGRGPLVVPRVGRPRWRAVASHGKGAIRGLLGRES